MPVNPLENLPETMRNTRRFAFEARLFSGMEGRAESGGGTRAVSSASHVTRTLLHEKLDRASSLHFTLPPPGKEQGAGGGGEKGDGTPGWQKCAPANGIVPLRRHSAAPLYRAAECTGEKGGGGGVVFISDLHSCICVLFVLERWKDR